MRIGIIARSDNTGLGNQTKELIDMLKPDKILLIDSTPFNKNNQQLLNLKNNQRRCTP